MKVRYRHYLAEFARKPQAVRQVAPELICELGEPYGKLWEMLTERYGAKEASRVLAASSELWPTTVRSLSPRLWKQRCAGAV